MGNHDVSRDLAERRRVSQSLRTMSRRSRVGVKHSRNLRSIDTASLALTSGSSDRRISDRAFNSALFQSTVRGRVIIIRK